MLCEIALGGNFMTTWACLTVLGLVSQMIMSGACFVKYYVRPTYEMWRWKTNPEYPTPAMVRDEIVQMLKGLVAATLCPTLSLWLSKHGRSQGFCGLSEQYGVGYHVFLFCAIWVGVDFFEYWYHHLGHRFTALWAVHKHHHTFYNPSPFAVIADEAPDQIVRASPLLWIPQLIPTNQDLIFFQFVLFFYLYGTYLHWGYEHPRLSPHQPYINTSYHHYMVRAAREGKNEPPPPAPPPSLAVRAPRPVACRSDAPSQRLREASAPRRPLPRRRPHPTPRSAAPRALDQEQTVLHRLLLQALGLPLRHDLPRRVPLRAVRAGGGAAHARAVRRGREAGLRRAALAQLLVGERRAREGQGRRVAEGGVRVCAIDSVHQLVL